MPNALALRRALVAVAMTFLVAACAASTGATWDGERLDYQRDEDGNRSVKGTYQGKAMDLEAAA